MDNADGLSAISLDNVEALASGESGTCIEVCAGLFGHCTTSTGATSKGLIVCITY